MADQQRDVRLSLVTVKYNSSDKKSSQRGVEKRALLHGVEAATSVRAAGRKWRESLADSHTVSRFGHPFAIAFRSRPRACAYLFIIVTRDSYRNQHFRVQRVRSVCKTITSRRSYRTVPPSLSRRRRRRRHRLCPGRKTICRFIAGKIPRFVVTSPTVRCRPTTALFAR